MVLTWIGSVVTRIDNDTRGINSCIGRDVTNALLTIAKVKRHLMTTRNTEEAVGVEIDEVEV